MQDFHHLLCGGTVQISRRFVRHDNRGVLCQRPGDGHPLLLSAGKLGCLGLGIGRHIHHIDVFRDVLLLLRPRHAGQHHAQLNVLVYGITVHQVEVLENISDVFLPVPFVIFRSVAAGILSCDEKFPLFIAVQSGNDVQQRGLAAAALAGNHHEFPHIQVEIHLGKSGTHGILIAVELRYVMKFNHMRHNSILSFPMLLQYRSKLMILIILNWAPVYNIRSPILTILKKS